MRPSYSKSAKNFLNRKNSKSITNEKLRSSPQQTYYHESERLVYN